MSISLIKNILTRNDCYKSGRTIKPIGMQLHTIGTAQNTAKSLAEYWNQSGISACVHYCIDAEVPDKVLQFLSDTTRSWADAGFGNSNLITVELMESDFMRYTGGSNYIITNETKFKADVTRAYNTAVKFFAMKCKEYGWNPQAKLPNGLYVVSSHDEGRRAGVSSGHVDPTHIWNKYGWTMDKFRADVKAAMGGSINVEEPIEPKYYRVRISWADEKSQIGAYEKLENAKANCPVGYSVFDDNGKAVYTPEVYGTQTSEFASLTEIQATNKLLGICKEVAVKHKLFPSVATAQTVLESGYCKTELAIKGNNVCGMKTSLSGNTWPNSTWDGKSKVNIRTAEQKPNGSVYYIYADFRKYPCIEDSVADRCAYILGAKNGSKLRYEGITNCKNYREQITLIKNGGYATDVSYVNKICGIIERFGLDKYDHLVFSSTEPETPQIPEQPETPIVPSEPEKPYRVGTGWENGKCVNQHNAFDILANAKKDADTASKSKKKTYYVFDKSGTILYKAKYTSENAVFAPYSIKTLTPNLRIRKSPNGQIWTENGVEKHTGINVLTIVDEKEVNGEIWGLLLAYKKECNGWVCLSPEYVKKV